jgi:NAD(P)-dependent dehydrogenase (short-subunit alcohol dehydrogenase family)
MRGIGRAAAQPFAKHGATRGSRLDTVTVTDVNGGMLMR